MNKLFSYRALQFYLLVLSIFILSASFYFQYLKELSPCPLCLMQRLATIFLIIIFLITTFIAKPKRPLWFILQIFFSVAGIYFASRQLWIMHFPSTAAATCLPQLQQMIHYLPIKETVKILLMGSDACSDPEWLIWGISMPGWSLVYFLFVFFSSLFIYFKNFRSP